MGVTKKSLFMSFNLEIKFSSLAKVLKSLK
jgi:hypothetical protein